MMDVIWTWAHLKEYEENLLNCEWSISFPLLVASVKSWKRNWPEVRRVIYLDEESYKILLQRGILKYFDLVEVIDFKKELSRFPEGFSKVSWALPKVLTMEKVTNPSWIVDCDTVLYKRMDEMCLEFPFIFYDRYENDAEHVYLDQRIPEFLYNSRVSFNAGFSYYSDPRDCIEFQRRILDANLHCFYEGLFDLPEGGEYTVYCEEGTLGYLVYNSDREYTVLGIQNDWCNHLMNKTEPVVEMFKDISKAIQIQNAGN